MEREKPANKMPKKLPLNGTKTNLNRKNLQPLASQKRKFGRDHPHNQFNGIPNDSSSFNSPPRAPRVVNGDAQSGNGVRELGYPGADLRVFISLDFKSKKELRDVRSKLENELSSVRNLVKRMENYCKTNIKHAVNGIGGVTSGKLKRVHSQIGSVDCSGSKPSEQLVTTQVENVHSEVCGSVKGTRKVETNESYHGADQKKKKSRTNDNNSGKMGLGRASSNFGTDNFPSKVLKSCKALLDKLMKHKSGGWIFSSPVDVEHLGLHDYYTIIKYPMDLGTVNSNLNSNRYKSPEYFAEDVRLTFHNAIRYNPVGDQINALAQQFLKMFEEKWAAVLATHHTATNVTSAYQEATPNQVSRKAPSPTSPIHSPTEVTMVEDKPQPVTNPIDSDPKMTNSAQPGRGRIPKPKAKDPNKRDMTFEEKQKLSTNLQELPSEKLEVVLQIIKKRNPHLCQSDEEIEVDIDSVDIETLWELDRLVINYKKHMSKIRRSSEMAIASVGGTPNLKEENDDHSVMDEPIENDKTGFSSSLPVPVPVQEEGESRTASASNGSSSSSSDSTSSSSDSDSESSSP